MKERILKNSLIATAAVLVASSKAPINPIESFIDSATIKANAETLNDFSAYDFEQVNENAQDTVYSINTVTNGNGTITTEKTYDQNSTPYGKAKSGDSVMVYIHAERGYQVSNVTAYDADNNVIFSDDVEKYSFKMPESDVTIVAEFKAVSYDLDYEDPENGYIEVFGEDSDNEIDESLGGKYVDVKLYPNDGFALSSLEIKDSTGDEVSWFENGENTVRFVMPTYDVSIVPVFSETAAESVEETPVAEETPVIEETAQKAVYNLNTITDGHGRIAVERFALGTLPYGQANGGDFVRIHVAEESGYDLTKLTVKDADGNVLFSGCDDQIYITMPESDVTISAEFEKEYTEVKPVVSVSKAVSTKKSANKVSKTAVENKAHTIDIVTDGNGRVSIERVAAGSAVFGTANTNDTVILRMNAKKGYEVKKITVLDENNKVVKTSKNDIATFLMPNSGVTVKAEFQPIAYGFDDDDFEDGSVEMIISNTPQGFEDLSLAGWKINGYENIAKTVDEAVAAVKLAYDLDPDADITIEAVYR